MCELFLLRKVEYGNLTFCDIDFPFYVRENGNIYQSSKGSRNGKKNFHLHCLRHGAKFSAISITARSS